MNKPEEKDKNFQKKILKRSESTLPFETSALTDFQSKLSVIRKIQDTMTRKVNNNETLPTFRNLIPIISDIEVLTQAHTNLCQKKRTNNNSPRSRISKRRRYGLRQIT